MMMIMKKISIILICKLTSVDPDFIVLFFICKLTSIDPEG